jgi:A/G-specific adenine glycosylase
MRKDEFQALVYDFYLTHRRILPWRDTKDPYKILLSELMLQQTQVKRVVEKYRIFIRKFPTIRSVANARLRTILDTWSGLGYNRRALALKRLAVIVMNQFGGRLPDNVELLKKLPGIGDATASAICAFAFNQPVVFLETNIRTVFIHHFFKEQEEVKDSQILPQVEKTLDIHNPREWYYALMDYGVSLKRLHGNAARRSVYYHKQSKFEGSDRQIRGAIIKLLIHKDSITTASILRQLPFGKPRIRKMIDRLAAEGFIEKRRGRISITQRI